MGGIWLEFMNETLILTGFTSNKSLPINSPTLDIISLANEHLYSPIGPQNTVNSKLSFAGKYPSLLGNCPLVSETKRINIMGVSNDTGIINNNSQVAGPSHTVSNKGVNVSLL